MAARLVSLVSPYVIAIAVLGLVCWAIRASRDGEPTRTPKPSKFVAAVYILYTLAFLIAAIVLIIAWLVAWLGDTDVAGLLLQAFILTLLGFLAVRIFTDSALNLIYVFRKPARDASAP